ncbi:MAG: LysR family transcriptional regulator [Candidatus Brevundimonas colombiensis]|uniref:LysR family transcriptional regulator n=1 Tax=Candidatus Brevundimonas colombiensis TaxID=3121376 RepID=A0AAJ5X1T3_9CAUL|nr:LysR family transcriptional regulator [Brevundimonas sp.]WEK41454.1 MAG: LysR family transcriptional regulator [Brevundimonas sp.]
MTFDLRNLQHFIAVADNGSFTGAADARALSQPALSRAIRLLEEDLNARLFDREGREINLTPAGLRLLPIARRLVREAELGLHDMQAFIQGSRGRVVVAALPSLAATLLPDALAAFRDAHPDIDVQVLDRLAGEVIAAVNEGHADVGLTIRPTDPSELRFNHLLDDPFCLVRSQDGEPVPESVSWAELASAPFIAMAKNTSVRETTDRAFAEAGKAPRPLFECSHVATVGALVAKGFGETALPALTLSHLASDRLAWAPLVLPMVCRDIGLVTRPDRVSTQARQFADLIMSQRAT